MPDRARLTIRSRSAASSGLAHSTEVPLDVTRKLVAEDRLEHGDVVREALPDRGAVLDAERLR